MNHACRSRARVRRVLAYRAALIGRSTPDLVLDRVECADPIERFLAIGDWLASWMSKNLRRTCAQQAASRIRPPSKSGQIRITVGMPTRRKVSQVLRGCSPLRSGVYRNTPRRHEACPWPLVAHVGPDPRVLVFPVPRGQHRGTECRSACRWVPRARGYPVHHKRFQKCMGSATSRRASSDPSQSRERRSGFAGTAAGDRHTSTPAHAPASGTRQSPGNRSRGGRCLHDLLAPCAGELGRTWRITL